MSPLLLALACTASQDSSSESTPHSESGTESATDIGALTLHRSWMGTDADDQLGSSVTAGGGRRFAGAPGVHRVHALDDELELVLEAEGRAGHALAWSDGLIVGAPLHQTHRGALLAEDGEVLATGSDHATLGAWVQVSGGSVLASAGTAVWRDGELMETGERVAAAVLVDDELVSFSHTTGGRAACVADLDGDGALELAVGDATRATVALYDADDTDSVVETLVGSGRFGAALACAEGRLAIGDPSRAEHAGAVWLVDHGVLAEPPLQVGEAGDELGFALAWDGRELLVGAPGTGDRPGSVLLFGP